MGERTTASTLKRNVRWPVVVALGTILALQLGCASSGPSRPPAAEPAAVPASTAQRAPAEIRSLALARLGSVEALAVEADRPLVWTSFRDASGDLVIELPNSVPAPSVDSLQRAGGLVTEIEVETLRDSERPLTRLVIRTREPSEHSLAGEGDTLRIQLVPVGVEAEPAEAVALRYEPLTEEAPEPLPDAPPAAPVDAVPPAEPMPAYAGRVGTAEDPLPGPPPTGVVASQLLAVDVLNAAPPTVILVAGDGEFAYQTFQLENPDRFVIDLSGVVNMSATSALPVGNEQLAQVRVGQFRPRPEPISRVVFDLNQPLVPTLERSADGLTVTFPEGAVGGITVAEAEPEPAMMAEPPEPMPAPAEAPPMPEPAAEVAVTEVAVETTDEGEVTAVEITETEVAIETTDEGEVTAVEITETEVAVTEDEVMVEVEELEIEEPPAMAAPPEPAPQPTVPVYEPTEQAAAPPPELPASTAPREVPPPAPAPAPSVTRPVGTTDVALFEAQEVQVEAPPEEEDPVLASFGSLVVSRPERQYVGEPIDMSLKNADLVETLRSFATISDLNFVIQPGVSGSVTVELKGVPWDQAMEQILKINNLGMEIDGTIVRIAPRGQLQQEAEDERRLRQARQQTVPLRMVMKSLSYSTANEIATILRNRTGSILSARGTVQVDQRTNTLIIRELPGNIDTVLAVIDNLDAPEPQVTIEARIIEATKSFSRSLGIEWMFNSQANNALGNTTGLQFPNNFAVDGGVGLLTGGANGFLNLSMGNIINSFTLDAQLIAAESEGLVNLVSAPRVTTLNNNPATIQSGVQIPIQTVTNRTVSVQFVNATLQLEVTPQVTAEGTVMMDISVAKRSPQPGLAVVGATNSPIATREATTKVIVRDGGTAVIGGIYEVSANRNQDRLPGLSNIPILGHLFKNRNRSDSNDELMIFITPRIVQM